MSLILISLDKLPEGRSARIAEINLEDKLKERLKSVGIVVGESIRKIETYTKNGPSLIEIKRTQLALEQKILEKILVCECEDSTMR